MDELETLLVLTPEHSRTILGSSYREGFNVLLAAGSKGIVRGFSFRMQVLNFSFVLLLLLIFLNLLF